MANVNKLLDGNSLLAIKSYVDDKLTSAYKIMGNVANPAALQAQATAVGAGYVYNVTASGTITQSINGVGTVTVINAGDNVVWVTATNSNDGGSYHTGGYWDVLAGIVDLSSYATQSWVSSNYLPLNGATLSAGGFLVQGASNQNVQLTATGTGSARLVSSGNTDITGDAIRFKTDEGYATFNFDAVPSAGVTFTFPATGGEIALAGSLSNYMPLNGATLTSGGFNVYAATDSHITFQTAGDGSINLYAGNNLNLIGAEEISLGHAASGKRAVLDCSSIASTDKTFTFPNMTGTFAMREDVYTQAQAASILSTGSLDDSNW